MSSEADRRDIFVRDTYVHPKPFWESVASSPLTYVGLTVVSGAAFLASRYKVALPSQYVVRTGIFIPKVAINKKAFQLPFQTAKMVSVQPKNFTFNLQAMSKEKMEFVLPGVYTIGPKDDEKSLEIYATLLSNTTEDELTHIIKGIIEGETRVLTASLTLEEIFSGRDQFRDNVTTRVNKELETLGLWIHNANIQEMSDHAGSEYFQFLRQRARANAENEARINIAEAKRRGDIEVKERQKETRIKMAEFETQAVMYENQRNIEVAQSNAELKVRQADFDRQSQIARIESDQAAALRASELTKEVETKRILEKQERLRSEVFVQAQVESEAKERAADAELYSKKAEADAIYARFKAESEGLQELFASAGHDSDLVMKYLMIRDRLLPELAKANADAIHGLQPKISVWNMGGDNKSNPIADIMKSLPPLVDTIYQQTGMKPPAWLMDTTAVKDSQ